MGEVVPLRVPVIPRIVSLVKRALDAGSGPNLVCLLNATDALMLTEEFKSTRLVSVTGTQAVDPWVTMHIAGARVRIYHDSIVADGSMVMQKEPESPADILKMLYDKDQMDSFMSKPHQFEDAQVFTWKGNTP